MNEQTNIVLILRSGGDFRIGDVYLLASHINKYWNNKIKPKIYCYTDNVEKETEVVGLTIRPLPNKQWVGWWSKMNLFSEQLNHLRPFLYMDLDTAIINNITAIVPPKDMQSNFITLRDFYNPKRLASGLMWIPDTKLMDEVYKQWLINKKRFSGDQNFIESVVKFPDLYWQDIFQGEYITTFKPNKVWRTEQPMTSAIVCFHGEPRIPKAALTVEWVKKYVNHVI